MNRINVPIPTPGSQLVEGLANNGVAVGEMVTVLVGEGAVAVGVTVGVEVCVDVDVSVAVGVKVGGSVIVGFLFTVPPLPLPVQGMGMPDESKHGQGSGSPVAGSTSHACASTPACGSAVKMNNMALMHTRTGAILDLILLRLFRVDLPA
jgi:hypothetical protein